MNFRTKKITAIMILLVSVVSSNAVPVKQEINEGWHFKQARQSNWYPATVPGVVHTDLISNELIDDPYFRMNERDVQWIDKEDWIYETVFSLQDKISEKENLRLTFLGLDTYADVYLNDSLILEANNMFREWRINVRHLLKKNKNKLKIYFHSPIKKAMPAWEALPFQYKAANDQSENGGLFDRKLSVFTRKAGYHYGWDWGPRLVTSGIWRPVFLEAWNDIRIENVHIQQKNVSAKSATLITTTEILSDKAIQAAKIKMINELTNEVLGEVEANLKEGGNKIDCSFTMSNPRLWWSNGLGEPHLYHIKTVVVKNDQIYDQQTNRIGIRSIKLIREPDALGNSFYFELNGIPVFAKGANYIPCDLFLPRVTKEIYKKTVLDAVNANMNMLRVWGGGIYEDDYFYDLCDENGILVWQDFMFACSIYPAEKGLLDNIKHEAIDNIRRLRNHPSIALWCGNNENLDAWFNWGWKEHYDKLNPAYSDIIWKQYYNQFHVVLPDIVNAHDPQTDYLPSSPFADINGKRDETSGDYHYWKTWQQGLPIATFNTAKSRFFSEYGYQSFPSFESVKKYAPEERDWNTYSDVMMWHQRAGMHANNIIERTIKSEYGLPKDFQSFLYLSQLLQGDAIKIAIESHRRNMPYCMGSLYWQHNDVWPAASWSSRDYYGQWKAQHYFVRKAFEDILISPVKENGKLNVYVASDRQKSFNTVINIDILSVDGFKIKSFKKKVRINPNTSKCQFSADIQEMLKETPQNEVIIYTYLNDELKKKYDNMGFLTQFKNVALPAPTISKSIKKTETGYSLTLETDKFAKGVHLSIKNDNTAFFSDNFFDMLPQKMKIIHVTTNMSQTELENRLTIISLYNTINK